MLQLNYLPQDSVRNPTMEMTLFQQEFVRNQTTRYIAFIVPVYVGLMIPICFQYNLGPAFAFISFEDVIFNKC